jgi:hypothetical protein
MAARVHRIVSLGPLLRTGRDGGGEILGPGSLHVHRAANGHAATAGYDESSVAGERRGSVDPGIGT